MTATARTCPTCRKPVSPPAPVAAGERPPADPFPFCSFRCQMVDLGRWLDEEYRIADGEDQSGGGVEGPPPDDGLT